jgi:iron complex transport system ATP-binding protein
MLRFENVSVRAGERMLLEDVSLGLQPGELVALVGPNGAGKTTLLRTALALHRPSHGRVTLDGIDSASLAPRMRSTKLALLPQHVAFFEPIGVLELVAAARYRFGEGRERALDGARRALERASAAPFADRVVTTLSGGERQRVALAAVLAQEAPLLLLDEPANHLDPAQQVDAYRLIGALWREGFGILCVTHDVNLLAQLGDTSRVRVAGLSGGRLRFELAFTAADLPARLSELFGIELVALDVEGRRALLPRIRELGS